MTSITLPNSSIDFIEKALPFLEERYDIISYLNPNNYNNYPSKPFRHLLAFGCTLSIEVTDDTQVFESWNTLRTEYPNEWLFVFVSYNAKNSTEEMDSARPNSIYSGAASFFIPEHVWEISSDLITILKGNGTKLIEAIQSYNVPVYSNLQKIDIQSMIDKETYIKTVEALQTLIRKGDAYEINYCIPFQGNGKIHPAHKYLELNALAPMPFSAFMKWKDFFILSASPERYIKKEQNKLISQPIKGTSKRGSTEAEDLKLIHQLLASEKEQSENTMIVDLVRNDLSRSAIAGSVHVSELRGVYSFPQVHQLISTIQSELDVAYSAIDAIQYSFPMGSMTGAPKVGVMKIIDEYELISRGPFSGSVGYMDPNNDFDFNVLIRSIFYNAADSIIFMEAGSAITTYADAASEYEECMLKINPMIQILSL